jgi:hypothetical protein
MSWRQLFRESGYDMGAVSRQTSGRVSYPPPPPKGRKRPAEPSKGKTKGQKR